MAEGDKAARMPKLLTYFSLPYSLLELARLPTISEPSPHAAAKQKRTKPAARQRLLSPLLQRELGPPCPHTTSLPFGRKIM